MEELKITRADRSFGTDRVMVFGPQQVRLRPLQGRQHSDVRDAVLRLSDSKTRFYHRIPSDDPLQPVKETEVSREEW